MRRIFNIDDGVEVLIESHYAMTMTETLNKLDLTLDEAGIGYGHRLVIREKQANSSGSRQPRQDLVLITVELTSVCKLYMSQKFTLFPFIFVVVINGLHCYSVQRSVLLAASKVSSSEPYRVPRSVWGCGISCHSVQSIDVWYEDVLAVFSNPQEEAQTVYIFLTSIRSSIHWHKWKWNSLIGIIIMKLPLLFTKDSYVTYYLRQRRR